MKINQLIELGFNKNEAKVYLSLISFGKASANQIISNTKFHKNIVYDNLNKLLDKGLITYVVESNHKIFCLAPSHNLIDFFEEKEKEVMRKKELAQSVSQDIDLALKKRPMKQEATIYRGVSGIKSFYKETLNQGDYVSFGAPKESLEIMGDYFWENYTKKRIKNKINVRLIFNLTLRKFSQKVVGKNTHVRFLGRQFDPRTETHIQADKVAIIVWSDEPILFLIQDKLVAQDYKNHFEGMWKVAKK